MSIRTVGQLVDYLQQYDDDQPVAVAYQPSSVFIAIDQDSDDPYDVPTGVWSPRELAMTAVSILQDFADEQARRPSAGWMVTPVPVSLAQAYATTALALATAEDNEGRNK